MYQKSTINSAGNRRLIIGSLLLALIVLTGLIVLTASVPPVSRDALAHHLALPKIYLKHGVLIDIPEIPFSYYPMNLDLIYFAALALGNDIIPKYTHFLFALLTAGLIYGYLQARVGTQLALLGALLYLSTPIVVRLSSEVYVDLGLGFFSMAAVYALIRWSESKHHQRALVVSGIWCGLALGTKYNALLVLAVLSLMIPFIDTRIRSRIALRAAGDAIDAPDPGGASRVRRWMGTFNLSALINALVFIIVALAVFSPWMIRNTVLTGNPVYPMLNDVFSPAGTGSSQDDWSQTSSMVQDTSNTLLVRRLVFKESPGYIALMPLRIFFEGQDDDPQRFDGQLNPILPFFILAAVVMWRADLRSKRDERWIWFAFAALFMLMTFFLAPIRIRYLLPILPALTILAIMGIFNLRLIVTTIRHHAVRRTGQMLLWTLIVVMLGFNARYAIDRYQKVEPWPYLNGHISRDQYITARRPEYPLIQYVNTHLAPNARILALFLGERRYYFDRDVNFNEGLMTKAVQKADHHVDIQSRLKKTGITHLVVRWRLFQQWVENNMSPVEIERLNLFFKKNTNMLYQSNGYVLLTIG